MPSQKNYKIISELLQNGLHQYEPVWSPETDPDDEIAITDETMWIPVCQKGTKNPQTLKTKDVKEIVRSLEKFYALDIAKQFIHNKDCPECKVACFMEQVDMLDYMPISEMFQNDSLREEDEEEEGFDFT